MFPTDNTLQAAKTFAKPYQLENITYACPFLENKTGLECVAYHASSKALEGTCYGFPIFILVDADLRCRFVTTDESLEIMQKQKENADSNKE